MTTKKTTTTAKAKEATKKPAAKKTTTSTSKKATSKVKITEEEVRLKAQAIYETRLKNETPGDAHSDWIQAEYELGIN